MEQATQHTDICLGCGVVIDTSPKPMPGLAGLFVRQISLHCPACERVLRWLAGRMKRCPYKVPVPRPKADDRRGVTFLYAAIETAEQRAKQMQEW